VKARHVFVALFAGSAPRGNRSSRAAMSATCRDAAGSGAPARARIALALLAALATLALIPATASAAALHKFAFSFDGGATPAGSFENPNGLAVDDSTGDVYVADIGHNAVDKFDASGALIATFGDTEPSPDGQLAGLDTPAGSFSFANPAALAVDNSTGPSEGDLYVIDFGHSAIDKFDSSGAYLGQITETPSGPFGEIYGIDVDASGNLWVYETASQLDKFDSAGTFQSAVPNPFGASFPGFAVNGSASRLYIEGNGGAYQLDGTTGEDLGQLDGGFTISIAVDRSNDSIFVNDGSHVAVYGSNAVALESFGSAELIESGQGGIAINSADGMAYVANPADAKVYAYEAVVVPGTTTNSATNQSPGAATLNGEVDPSGIELQECFFEYGPEESYGQTTPCDKSPAEIGAGTTPIPVHADLSLLAPGITYHYRLVAANSEGTARGADATFTTADAPRVDEITFTTAVGETTATLHATVNPNRADTTYRFQYGTTTAYGTDVPLTGAAIGSGSTDVPVSQALTGLQPGTLYHYRVLATNAVGTTPGGDRLFATPGPLPAVPASPFPGRGRLPDDRGWELVSPPDKNGGDVIGDSARTHAAADGSAVAFASLQGFADVHGTGVATEYLSQRSNNPAPDNNGWTTHAITPPQDSQTLRGSLQALEPGWTGEMSADLTHGVFRAWSPLTDAPEVAEVQNLYVRGDLRTPGLGTYALATDCTACAGTPLPSLQTGTARPWFAGASADFSHVAFESVLPLVPGSTGDSSGAYNVYEWDQGTLRLASLVPPPGETSCGDGGPTCVAAASAVVGQAASRGVYTPHILSEDGSHLFFTSPGNESGVLYVRINGSKTAQINASEKAPPDEPQPATFQTASADGHRAFFITSEQLVDTDTDNLPDLYMYDEEAPVGHRLSRVSVDQGTGVGSRGAIGTSRDGHWVYFVNDHFEIDLWHDGTVSVAGRIKDTQDLGDNVPYNWNLEPLQARVTPSGHELLFATHSGFELTGHDHGSSCANYLAQGTGPCQELYVYSADTDSLVCASCDPSGGPSTANARVSVRTGQGGSLTGWHLPHAFSDDGTKLFFSSRAALVRGDTNGKIDAYEWEAQGSGGCQRAVGCISLLSSGTSPDDSYFMDAGSEGNDVFILTRQRLVGWDVDQAYDLYDARVGGGFPQPPTVPAPCGGESCRPASAPPASPAAASAVFAGPANPKLCRKGAVRRHGKCVKKPGKHQGPKSHKRARHNRGGAK
jgi:sugar lactone lactonase YvrE